MSRQPDPLPRVLMLGFDSAAPDLVEEGIAEGWLPHLRRLHERGTYGRLQSTSKWLVSSHWPSFSMGVPPNEHGSYHFIQWRPQEMALRRLDPSWMLREPFWRELGREGVRVVALDVPYTPAPRTSETVELSGWATSEVVFEPYAQLTRPRSAGLVDRAGGTHSGRAESETRHGIRLERDHSRPGRGSAAPPDARRRHSRAPAQLTGPTSRHQENRTQCFTMPAG